jgi:hypothetical protein
MIDLAVWITRADSARHEDPGAWAAKIGSIGFAVAAGIALMYLQTRATADRTSATRDS